MYFENYITSSCLIFEDNFEEDGIKMMSLELREEGSSCFTFWGATSIVTRLLQRNFIILPDHTLLSFNVCFQ